MSMTGLGAKMMTPTNFDRIAEIRKEMMSLGAAISHCLSENYAGRDGLAKAAVYAGQLTTECTKLREIAGIEKD